MVARDCGRQSCHLVGFDLLEGDKTAGLSVRAAHAEETEAQGSASSISVPKVHLLGNVEQCAIAMKESEQPAAQSCLTLQPHELWSARLLFPWDSPGKSTGVGCHALPQEIILTQGPNSGFLHHRQILYHLSHRGNHENKGDHQSNQNANLCREVRAADLQVGPACWPLASSSMTRIQVPGRDVAIDAVQTLLPCSNLCCWTRRGKAHEGLFAGRTP